MKKLLYLAVAALFSLAACNQNTPSETTEKDIQTNILDVGPDEHTAENSLDYWGSYQGTLPCASCPGIDTEVTLNKDGTFVRTMTYLEQEDSTFQEEGQYEIKGNIVTLKGLDNGPAQYFVGESYIKQLDSDGKEIEGELAEYYVLNKELQAN